MDGGIPNEKHRRDKLLAGLTPPIQNELQKYRDYPETREELLQTAIKIEDTTKFISRGGRKAGFTQGRGGFKGESKDSSNTSGRGESSYRGSRYRRGSRGRGSFSRGNADAGQSRDSMTYNYCKKQGHWRYDCPELHTKGKVEA